ncbi:hypothetical protein OH77DRAFT_1522287 [Trametes cingulata]|nr:hypothetical protein OH77DRAFT_1522287 [Trametes cingulata]
MASIIFAHISLGGTLGVTYMGSTVSSMLYGLTCLQTVSYFRSKRAKADSHGLRLLVATLLFFDTVHQAIVTHICYNYLVLGVKDPLRLTLLVWSIPVEVLLNLHGIAALCMMVANELTISAFLAYYLYSRKTGVRRTNSIVNRLIALTVTTGMLTTVFLVANLITYTMAHDDLYSLLFNFLLAKLYSNALLTSLNSREYILGIDDDDRASGQEAIMLTPHSMDFARPANVRLGSHGGVHVAMDQFMVSVSSLLNRIITPLK